VISEKKCSKSVTKIQQVESDDILACQTHGAGCWPT